MNMTNTYLKDAWRLSALLAMLAAVASLGGLFWAGLYRDPELGIALAWRLAKRPNAAWAERYRPGFAAAMPIRKASCVTSRSFWASSPIFPTPTVTA